MIQPIPKPKRQTSMKTAVIIGTGPSLKDSIRQYGHDLNMGLPEDEVVRIGVNGAPSQCYAKLDYWMVCDGHKLASEPMLAEGYAAATAMEAVRVCWRPMAGGVEYDLLFDRAPMEGKCNNHQPVGGYTIPTQWDGTLAHVWSVVTAAVNLAVVLGVERIILVGIDLSGYTVCMKQHIQWEEFRFDIEAFIRECAYVTPIYRAEHDQPLSLPVWGVTEASYPNQMYHSLHSIVRIPKLNLGEPPCQESAPSGLQPPASQDFAHTMNRDNSLTMSLVPRPALGA